MASESSVEENDSVAQGNCSNDSSAIQNMECVKRCGLDHEVLLQDCRSAERDMVVSIANTPPLSYFPLGRGIVSSRN